jgi:hypothetical protein
MDANDRPSAASRRLGAASLLAGCGPPLSLCIVFATPDVAGGAWAFAVALLFAPAAGFALGLAGVCWRGRASRLAAAGLVLNCLWAGLLLARFVPGPPRNGWYKE